MSAQATAVEGELNLWLRVEMTPHTASYDEPEDHYDEFVRQVSVTLYERTYDDLRDEGSDEVVAKLEGLIVRQAIATDNGIDVHYLADAHSAKAGYVCGYLQSLAREGDDEEEARFAFFTEFDANPDFSNALFITSIDWERENLCTPEMVRGFMRRAVDQFDVTLVLIERQDGSFSKHFEGFFEPYNDGPFLIYSKAHQWPGEPSEELDSEPEITAPGGTA